MPPQSRADEARTTTIIVNGREKEVESRELTYDDVVALAYEDPPTGPYIVITVTYRRGPGRNPEGVLSKDDSVHINKGMVFNVTATDKS